MLVRGRTTACPGRPTLPPPVPAWYSTDTGAVKQQLRGLPEASPRSHPGGGGSVQRPGGRQVFDWRPRHHERQGRMGPLDRGSERPVPCAFDRCRIENTKPCPGTRRPCHSSGPHADAARLRAPTRPPNQRSSSQSRKRFQRTTSAMTGTRRAWRGTGAMGTTGQPRTSALPVPGASVDSSRPLRRGADVTAPARSGRLGPRWEGCYPRCDTAGSEGGPSGEASHD